MLVLETDSYIFVIVSNLFFDQYCVSYFTSEKNQSAHKVFRIVLHKREIHLI